MMQFYNQSLLTSQSYCSVFGSNSYLLTVNHKSYLNVFLERFDSKLYFFYTARSFYMNNTCVREIPSSSTPSLGVNQGIFF